MGKRTVLFTHRDSTPSWQCSVLSSLFTCVNNSLTSSVGIVLIHFKRILLHWVVSASKEALMFLCLCRLNRESEANDCRNGDCWYSLSHGLNNMNWKKKWQSNGNYVREQDSHEPIYWLDLLLKTLRSFSRSNLLVIIAITTSKNKEANKKLPNNSYIL